MREREVRRKTAETEITVRLDLDGKGRFKGDTPFPFLNHMLSAMAKHGQIDLEVKAAGDTEVDCHHVVEDIGIVMGRALGEAMGEGKGMRRFAHAIVPMDEALATVAVDCGGRGYLVFRCEFSMVPLGGIPGGMFEHFFYSLCTNAGITAHISCNGRNDHHMCEAIFKAFGIALSAATRIEPERQDVPSTKGTI